MSILRTIPYAALSASLLFAGGASAQSMRSIDAREDYQQDRIDQGIRDGSLTRGEADRLERGEQRILRYEERARADGSVSPYERQRLDNMLDREGRAIGRDERNGQRADGGGWGDRNGGRDGWGRDRDGGWGRDRDWRADGRGWGDRDRDGGWGRDRDRNFAGRDGWGRDGWGRDRDNWNNGNHTGWDRGEHNGWDGNRPNGIERRDARDQQRIYNGVRDGQLTRGEFSQLERGQERIDNYERRARADGNLSSNERNRIDQMQNRESRQIYADTHNNRTFPGTQPGNQPGTNQGQGWGNGGGWQHQPQQANGQSGSNGYHGGGNGGWQHQPQQGGTTATSGTPQQPPTNGYQGGGNRGWQHQPQSNGTTATGGMPQPTNNGYQGWGNRGGQYQPRQPSGGSSNWGGWHTQQASGAPTAPMMRTASMPSTGGGGRSFGGRH
jgi:hypothetical protein